MMTNILSTTKMIGPLLEVDSLKVHFLTEYGIIRAVEDVSFQIQSGETLALVGESGCGKSVTGRTIMRLIPTPPGKILEGKVVFEGRDLLMLKENEMRKVRGKRISMVFQEPMSSLNPVFTIGNQLRETISLHQDVGKREAITRALEILNLVGLPNPEKQIHQYPHQLSGGMAQRAMIAIALSCNPSLLIADEPTTALDVTIQAQILELLQELQEKLGLTLILISHNMGVVAQIADWVAVMYAGRIFEFGTLNQIFKNSKNPYTKGLLHSIPGFKNEGKRFNIIPGQVPDAGHLPHGCKFFPRCHLAVDQCQEKELVFEVENGHWSRCIRWENVD